MNDINLNIPYARIIPDRVIQKFDTYRLDTETPGSNLFEHELVTDRFRIIETHPEIGSLKCYTVADRYNPNRCGACGMLNTADSPIFCERCGYQFSESCFLLLEARTNQAKVFEYLIKHDLQHRGIIRFFEAIPWNKKIYIMAQQLSFSPLSDLEGDVTLTQALNWIIQLLSAVIFLHQQHIFNFDLSPDGIFLFADGPKLVNFSRSLVTRSNPDHWLKSDTKSLAKTCLFLLSKTAPKDQSNMSFLKNIFSRVSQGSFYPLKDLFQELTAIKENPDDDQPLFTSDNRTVLLTDKGVSISVGMASDVGMVRTLNEDSIGAFELINILQSISTPYGFYMVADGMGGHQAGEEASKIAIEYITRKIINSFNTSLDASEQQARQILEEAVFSANNEIYKLASMKNNDMGTTIIIAYLANNRAFLMNVGDARAYLYSNRRLSLITQDHSLVYRLYKTGQLNYEEIYHHPLSNQVLCALGEPNLQQNLSNLEKQANHPYFFTLNLKKGDGLLLCTDGLWQMLGDTEMEQIINKHSHPQNAVEELVHRANQNGGDDNISLIFVKTN